MEKCKFCQAELEENSLICPNCGKENTPEPPVEETLPREAAPQPAPAEATAPVEETTPVEETAPVEETPSEEIPSAEKAEEPAPETAQPKGILVTPGKLAAAAAVFVLLIAIIAALIVTGARSKAEPAPSEGAAEATEAPTVPADGNPDDASCKGTYTAEDAALLAAADTVVATAGDFPLTNEDLQLFYWTEVWQFIASYGSYAQYFGLDLTQPLDTQVCGMAENRTWQQFFLESALNRWHQAQAFAAEADKAEFKLDPEIQQELDSVLDTLEEFAVSNGMENSTALLNSRMGAGATQRAYAHLQQLQYRGFHYLYSLEEQLKPTDQEVEAYFAENEAAYADSGLTKDTCTVDVRHILISTEADANGDEISQEAWDAAEAKARELLAQWESGDKTEDSFAELANQNSTDPGSNTNGGLYAGVNQGDMVAEFDAWCFDPARQPGDTGIVKTTYGYHVMYFSGSKTVWQDQVAGDLTNQRMEAMVTETMARYPLQVDYEKILLGNVSLMG